MCCCQVCNQLEMTLLHMLEKMASLKEENAQLIIENKELQVDSDVSSLM